MSFKNKLYIWLSIFLFPFVESKQLFDILIFYCIIRLVIFMNLNEKLVILSDTAKYDASCSSSGSKRNNNGYGNTYISGICHSFSADGRCMSPT